ncbi:homolog to endonuclease VapC [Natronomonas pharaonis DSM 2160]|uniref:Ribonuclease VapC n=1 Tax=Natronomonas pharaonis (strain ATCC 35678 / DSM 2160 / CIP 103997 / JCM 8858 / NBRC 14720 / NCIMB 2260 / Gabara) TaxID=348780 RepID=A0A1U7EYV5_NATPD|nr:PIN domain-containing protein [Natronomonas pharaonis]CAI50424.1 homolog to endonuclease VapC [Natronomonas pharaonis DSM 2160]
MTLLVIDTNLLSDYLNGTDEARAFLAAFERDRWGVPSIVLFEALMGSLYGHIDATPDEIVRSVDSSMEVLETGMETAIEAQELQAALLSRGAPVDQLDALIAAAALEHGGTFATAEKQFWTDDVQEIIQVEPYDPY